jgi:flagellar basal-body rod protein FlgB
MPDPIFNDLALRALSSGLDGLALRQKLTADNIANVDTPGYKAQHVSFEGQLQQAIKDGAGPGMALQTTDDAHLSANREAMSSWVTLDHQDNTLRNDGNNVDIDLEMTSLAETSIRYQALSQLVGMKLSLLKSLVRDSR